MKVLEKIKKDNLPVIIVGAGVIGEVLNQACKKAGVKVECFCDNNLNKTREFLDGIPIIHTPSLKNKYKEANFLISAADIRDVVYQLEDLGYVKWYPCSSILRDFDIYQCNFSKPIDFVAYAVATAVLCHDSFVTPDKLFLRSVDVVVTERCSLKCRDCSNLMRYYKNPQDTKLEELINEIDRLCFIVDEINEIRILGGEPFMYKDVHLVIKRLIDEPKVKKIVIYTNGTIIPREEQLENLKSNKVLFIVTNYGDLSRNLDQLTKKISDNGIAFYVQKVGGWTDCSKIKKHNRNNDQQKEIFKMCCAKNTITLSKGKLYRCPYSANAARLNAVPDFKNDSVNIFDEKISIVEMKKKVKNYLLEKDFLETCDYCNGRTFGDPEIQPAIQQIETNDYQQYNY